MISWAVWISANTHITHKPKGVARLSKRCFAAWRLTSERITWQLKLGKLLRTVYLVTKPIETKLIRTFPNLICIITPSHNQEIVLPQNIARDRVAIVREDPPEVEGVVDLLDQGDFATDKDLHELVQVSVTSPGSADSPRGKWRGSYRGVLRFVIVSPTRFRFPYTITQVGGSTKR